MLNASDTEEDPAPGGPPGGPNIREQVSRSHVSTKQYNIL